MQLLRTAITVLSTQQLSVPQILKLLNPSTILPTSVTPVLIISGPVGVGKTSVASEVSETLIPQAIPHTFIDLDQLRYTYPRAAGDRFGSQLGLQNLQSIWSNCCAAGSKNLILATVIETAQDVQHIQSVIPQATTTVCQLWAQAKTLEARLRQREVGSSLDWHLARSIELANSLPQSAPADMEIWTDDQSINHISNEISRRFNWVKPLVRGINFS